MPISVANVGLTNTKDYQRQRINDLAYAMSTRVVSTDSNTATGNAAISGTFSCDVLVANSISIAGNTSNLNVNYITANVVTGTTGNIATFYSNSLTAATANAVTLTSNSITSNNGSVVVLSTNSLTGNTGSMKNFTANTLVVGNSTVNVTITAANSTLQSNGNYFLSANGTYIYVPTTFPPAGSNTQVTYNDSGSSSGSTGLTFDKTSNTLTIANSAIIGTTLHQTVLGSTFGLSPVAIDTIALSTYRCAEYVVSIKDNAANNYQVSKLLMIHNGGTATVTEYGMISTAGTSLGSFDSTANATVASLLFTPTSTSTNITINKVAVAV
jgi:RNase P/RNase MRP subunit p29